MKESDIQGYDKIIDAAKEIWKERDEEYGDLWKEVDIADLLAPMKLKVERIFKQLEKPGNGEVGNRAVITDSILDIINYASMVGMRIGAFDAPVKS